MSAEAADLQKVKFSFSYVMPFDLRQVTTIEVMEALNSLMRRPKGSDRKNIAFGEIAQIVADKRGVDPMVRFPCSCSGNRLQHSLADHTPNFCLLCFVLSDVSKRPDFGGLLQYCSGARAVALTAYTTQRHDE